MKTLFYTEFTVENHVGIGAIFYATKLIKYTTLLLTTSGAPYPKRRWLPRCEEEALQIEDGPGEPEASVSNPDVKPVNTDVIAADLVARQGTFIFGKCDLTSRYSNK